MFWHNDLYSETIHILRMRQTHTWDRVNKQRYQLSKGHNKQTHFFFIWNSFCTRHTLCTLIDMGTIVFQSVGCITMTLVNEGIGLILVIQTFHPSTLTLYK